MVEFHLISHMSLCMQEMAAFVSMETLLWQKFIDFEVFQKYRQTSAAVLACSPAGDTASIFGTTHSRILILTRVAPRIGFC